MGGIAEMRINEDDNGIRVDRWFARHIPALSHSHLEKLLRTGRVRLDGKRVKAGGRVSTGQVIRLPPQVQGMRESAKASSTVSSQSHPNVLEQERLLAESLVIHKDSSVFILNKPAGLATQGGSGIRRHVDGLLHHLAGGKKQRPRLVHRLDRDTSGVLVIARTVPAAAALSESLRRRDAAKIYWALTKGVPRPRRGTIKSMLAKSAVAGANGREEKMTMITRDTKTGKSAVTEYAVISDAGGELSWIAVKAVTGRTHQIRVHLASLGTPIIGDAKYGGAVARGRGQIENKLHLHARSIDIAHPEHGRLRATAPLPPHMLNAWRLLGFDQSAADDAFSMGRRK